MIRNGMNIQSSAQHIYSKRFYNKLANILTVAFTTGKYSDTQSGFRLLNRRAIETINLTQDDFSFCSEMIVLAEEYEPEVDGEIAGRQSVGRWAPLLDVWDKSLY